MGARALAGKRVLAWLFDWLLILLLPLAILPVGLLLYRAGVEFSQAGANVFGFLALVAPVTAWLGWRETGPRAATPGKRRQGLRVVAAATGAPVGYARALLRNALKVALPWQLGHQVAFGFAVLGEREVGAGLIAVSAVCYAIIGLYLAGLLLGSGRTLYDRLSGTGVVVGPQGPVSTRRAPTPAPRRLQPRP